jgi:lipoprotein signal peptidase
MNIYNSGIFLGINVPGIVYWRGLILLFLVLWEVRVKSWGLLLVIIGGFLNFWENLKYGYVTDYWKIPFFDIYNNFMDWLIFIGIIIFIIELWKKRQ